MNVIVILFITAVLSLYAGVFKAGKSSQIIAIIGIIAALITSFFNDCSFFDRYTPLFVFDKTAKIFTQISLFTALLILLLGKFAFRLIDRHQSEVYSLILFSLCGVVTLFGHQNLVTLFLGIEILSIPLYVLAGSNKNDLRSNEASMKYFLLGAFATGFLLFGIALIYGVTGSFSISEIRQYSIEIGSFPVIYLTGIILLMVGLLFKISIAPFHFWAPDVYEGSPSLITSFMASIVKIAGFVTLFKLLENAFVGQLAQWQHIIFYLSILTMVSANVMGILQKNAKRMLAYSSISHAGYLLLIFFNTNAESTYVLGFYLLAYSLATVGVFIGLIYVERIYQGLSDIQLFNGLAKKNPILALASSVSLLSMAGIPLTAGFMGKLTLFAQALETQPILVIVAVLGSAVSIAYYLKLIVAMYFKPQNEEIKSAENAPLIYELVAIAVIFLIIALGVFPQPVFNALSSAW
ncbi:MAG: NADH-quinone oxidoreductase subunit N [Flavobacteriaceae bacterium]|jgi:NADH-quinone oxidoreductase subunit N|nr:NADH-quinone oxidoreductase subunit N [Flavobacteriaceae bacterium]